MCQHYGFQSTGAHFLDLASINLQPDEEPEDLFQRLMAFFEDNLLSVNCGSTHHGEQVTVDEDLSPTLENTIAFLRPTLTRQTEVWFRIVQQVASLTQARDLSSSCIPLGGAPLY